MQAIETGFRTVLFHVSVDSRTAPEFIDITDQVVDAVGQSAISNGTVLVFSKHTTLAVTIQENEPLLLVDMAKMLERLSPENASYHHNDFAVRTVHMHEDECPNGHSHCQHLTLGSSETMPLVDGNVILGEFQRIFAVELDAKKAMKVDGREVLVHIMGA
jgi:secondary thiamine-phosphate synthase enzyme